MISGYFLRVAQETPTKFWINNPTGPEMEWAVAAGAVSCTTNPSYCSKLITGEPGYIRCIIDEVIKDIKDDDVAAEQVYRKVALRIMHRFRPLYQASGGAYGYVTVQGDPRRDDNPGYIIESALQGYKLSKNFMAKIPVTVSGIQAMEDLVTRDIPICATEVFSIAQALYVCESYRRASQKSGKHPPFYVTHITGIFDQYLAETVERENINIAPEILAEAGCIVARKEYRILKEKGYECTMLGGGARGTRHFTEMVGSDMHVTINWNTAQSLLEADGPVIFRIEAETPRVVLDELSEKLPDFRKAFHEDALLPKEFEGFGPLLLFRNMFLEGYAHLRREIAARRVLVSQN